MTDGRQMVVLDGEVSTFVEINCIKNFVLSEVPQRSLGPTNPPN